MTLREVARNMEGRRWTAGPGPGLQRMICKFDFEADLHIGQHPPNVVRSRPIGYGGFERAD